MSRDFQTSSKMGWRRSFRDITRIPSAALAFVLSWIAVLMAGGGLLWETPPRIWSRVANDLLWLPGVTSQEQLLGFLASVEKWTTYSWLPVGFVVILSGYPGVAHAPRALLWILRGGSLVLVGYGVRLVAHASEFDSAGVDAWVFFAAFAFLALGLFLIPKKEDRMEY